MAFERYFVTAAQTTRLLRSVLLVNLYCIETKDRMKVVVRLRSAVRVPLIEPKLRTNGFRLYKKIPDRIIKHVVPSLSMINYPLGEWYAHDARQTLT